MLAPRQCHTVQRWQHCNEEHRPKHLCVTDAARRQPVPGSGNDLFGSMKVNKQLATSTQACSTSRSRRDIDRYHWNTAKFKTLWRTKFAVLMARERGRIGSDAALGDMPKRLQAHSYDEMNEGPAR